MSGWPGRRAMAVAGAAACLFEFAAIAAIAAGAAEPLSPEPAATSRDETPAALPPEVRLGWFGPSDPADPDTGPFWNGATLAVEEINAGGGVLGRPVRLIPAWSASPWAGGVSRLTRLVYDDHVLAIIGSIDGAATHLAEQVAAKALVAVISPGSTDPTVNLAGVPWMYSLLPGDDVQARAVAAWIAAAGDRRPVVLISGTDHDSRATAAAFRSAFRSAGLALAAAFECAPDAADADTVAGQAVVAGPRAVVVLASPSASGRIAASLRAAGFAGTLTGGSNMARQRFLEVAGPAAEGALAPLVSDPEAPGWQAFARAYAARFGTEPDFTSAAAYDSVQLTADALRQAHLDPARLRTTLSEAAPWAGANGTIRFDPHGRNTAPTPLATLRTRTLNTRTRPTSRPEASPSRSQNPQTLTGPRQPVSSGARAAHGANLKATKSWLDLCDRVPLQRLTSLRSSWGS